MKENKISVEEVELCLEEIDESIESQKQVEKALGMSFCILYSLIQSGAMSVHLPLYPSLCVCLLF